MFFLHNEIEDNLHLWTCPKVIDILRPIFKTIFKIIIVNNSDRYFVLYEDAIKFCQIFSWTDSILATIDDAPHLGMLNGLSSSF